MAKRDPNRTRLALAWTSAGLALVFKLFWHKVQSFFGIEVAEDDESAD